MFDPHNDLHRVGSLDELRTHYRHPHAGTRGKERPALDAASATVAERCRFATIGTDHVDRRARRQARKQCPNCSTGLGRECCDLVADLEVNQQFVEVERGNDSTLSSVEGEGLGAPVHAASIGDDEVSAIGDFQLSEP